MPLLKHELRRGLTALIIWTGVIAFMLGVCVLIYPEMEKQMGEISEMFANMGSFSAAFGMDKVNFGEFMGYFATECGNVLGLGGAFFAALLGISALAKEEGEHTADFLLTHPVSRPSIVLQKLCSILVQLIALNAAVICIVALCTRIVGEAPDFPTLARLLLAYFILQIEIAAVCFCISAFLRHGGLGIGLGVAALLYFLSIVANLTEDAKFLKYITPFGYANGTDIVADGRIDVRYLAVGLGITAAAIGVAFVKYCRKDIHG